MSYFQLNSLYSYQEYVMRSQDITRKLRHDMQIPLFLQTAYDANFKLMVIRKAEETNKCNYMTSRKCSIYTAYVK
jgi:hypothetical protein